MCGGCWTCDTRVKTEGTGGIGRYAEEGVCRLGEQRCIQTGKLATIYVGREACRRASQSIKQAGYADCSKIGHPLLLRSRRFWAAESHTAA